jgi:CheY-like chemotaxis protein
MNGDISVQSPADPVLNRGSVFTFSLRLKLPAKQVSQASAISNGREKLVFKKSMHFLIVDDSKVNLLVAKMMVQKFGGKVTTAESGTEAINLAKANEFDVVLMDVQMPELDGHQATMELRKLNYAKPIIALSANAYSEDIQKSLDAGMNGHLQKPFTEEKLFQKIIQFIS